MSSTIKVLHRKCLTCRQAIRKPNQASSRLNRSFGISSRQLSSSEQGSGVRRSTSASTSTTEEDEGVKINTWFLNQPQRSTRPQAPTSSSPSSSAASIPNQFFTHPITPSLPQDQDIPPIPENTPPILRPLHQFLTSPNSEASEVIHGTSVRIYDTSKLIDYMDTKGLGDLLGPLTSEGGEGVGTMYKWIIIAQVKGRGRGVVARGDGVLRRWLLKNPLHPSITPSPHEYPKTPRISLDSDWSIVPLNLGPGPASSSTSNSESESEVNFNVCVNLFSEEGRERWKLDEMWGEIPSS